MHAFMLSVALLFLTAFGALAQCGGSDLRPTLTAPEQRELDARIAATPYPEGLLWRATRGAQTLYLVGTVHISDPRLDRVMAAVRPLLDSADLVMVEQTAAEQAKLEAAVLERPDLAFLPEGTTLPELMTQQEWQRMARAAQDRGIPGFMAARFQPWYLAVVLSLPGCAIAGINAGGTGLDARIMDAAEAAGVPQRALESYDVLFKLMGSDPLERQIDFLRLGAVSNAAAEDALATLLASYFEERTAEVIELNRITSRRYIDMPADTLDDIMDEMLDRLLVQRNRAWMDAILAAPDGVSVIASGAGHLPGTFGLLNLLEQNGFTLTRLPL